TPRPTPPKLVLSPTLKLPETKQVRRLVAPHGLLYYSELYLLPPKESDPWEILSDEFCIPCSPHDYSVSPRQVDGEAALLREKVSHLEDVIRFNKVPLLYSSVPIHNVIYSQNRGYEETFEEVIQKEREKYENEHKIRLLIQTKNQELITELASI